YIFYNFIYALFSYPIGMLADKIGLRNTYLFGLSLFVLVYIGMAFEGNYWWYIFLFVLYGIYAAATEGISKALLSLQASKADMANALGSFSGLQSIAALISSSFAGLIWYSCNASVSFIISAIGAFCVIIYFISMHPKKYHDPINQ
ncbi:MAG TPA: MFS transporter, partial [Saprospiraceae bacterium]|nr:MFS transporter [Saprospiraceae bacterium]